MPKLRGRTRAQAGAALKKRGTRATHHRVARLVGILHLIRSEPGWHAGALASRFGVSRTRLFQDLSELNAAGMRIVCDGRGYRSLTEGPSLPVPLTVTEVMAVLLPGETVGNGLAAHARAARSKLADLLPRPFRVLFGERNGSVRVEAQATPANPAWMAVLQEGLAKRMRVQVRYFTASKATSRERRLDPLGMFFRGSAWYLVAREGDGASPKTFRVDRIEEASLLPEAFELSEAFRVEDYLGDAFGVWRGGRLDAAVRVEPSKARVVGDEALAKGLELKRSADGGGVLEIPIGHVDEVAWWLMQFADGITVLRPPELRDRVVAMARRLLEVHESPPGKPQH